jgi:hypothetical protein
MHLWSERRGYEIGWKLRPIDSSIQEKAALALVAHAELITNESPESQFGIRASNTGRKGLKITKSGFTVINKADSVHCKHI